MGLFDRWRKAPEPENKVKYLPNPHRNPKVRSGFFSGNEGRLLGGWDTTSNSIDFYLNNELRSIRARSRKMVRSNPYGKRFVATMKGNVVGPDGVKIQSQTVMSSGELDTKANDAVEAAFKDWACKHCDYHGKLTWIDMQNMAVSAAAQDGEFIFRLHRGVGKYGLKLEIIDPELLDVQKNEYTSSGNEIRLGVEYSKSGIPVRYHFRQRALGGLYEGYTRKGDSYTVSANYIIHGYINEWPDQSRGIPWMTAGLEKAKHLEKYQEAAIVKARSTAATMAVLKSVDTDAYTGAEDGVGEYSDATLDEYEAGTIKDIGNRDIVNLDSDYPHQMYGEFIKECLQGLSSGWGLSYHSLSNNLEGVNYSSIRAGVLEDREVYKGLQNWLIRALIQPVFEEWMSHSYMKEAIKIGRYPLSRKLEDYFQVSYQPRRWAWVDPQKDAQANQLAIDNGTTSRSKIIREQGDDPETIWREIARENALMEKYGINQKEPEVEEAPEPVEDRSIMDRAFDGVSLELAGILSKALDVLERNGRPEIHNHVTTERHEMKIENHLPETSVTVEAVMPEQEVKVDNHITLPETEVRIDAPVNVEVKPADVTVVDNHPTRAIQTVERDEDGEIDRTVINYER